MKTYPKITSIFLNVTNACNLRCRYCVPAGTMVIMSDFSQQPIESIKIGDSILGFNERRRKYSQRRVLISTVQQVHKTIDDVIRITFDDGSFLDATKNHPILRQRKYKDDGWTPVGECRIGQKVMCIPEICATPPDINHIDYINGIYCFYNMVKLQSKRITDMTPVGRETVYNLGTDTRTFFANNIAVHNCFVEQHQNYMSYQTAKDATDFLIQNAEEAKTIPSITFFGGEPMLCWDSIIVPLTKYIRDEYRKPFSLSMTSNCILMTDDKLEFLKKNNIGLLFSIDGDADTQDWNRPMPDGRGSFSVLAPKIPKILKCYPSMTFRSTVIPKTCGHIFHNIMFARDFGYKNFFVIPNVFEEWCDNDKRTAESEMRKYSNYFIDEFHAGRTPILFNTYEDSFRKILRINDAIENGICRDEATCSACAKCGLGASSFASIDYKGNIYACQELASPHGDNDKFYIGNIYSGVDNNLRECLMGSFTEKIEHGADCKACRLNRICDGGCVANNYMATGDINRMPPVFCWWLKLILDEAIYICGVLGAEKNKSFISYWKHVHCGG